MLAHCCGPQIARAENVLAVVMAAEVHQTATQKGCQWWECDGDISVVGVCW